MDGSDNALVAALVYIDLDNDQAPDTNEPRVLTDDTGGYMLSGLGRGHVRRWLRPAGWILANRACSKQGLQA